MTERSLIPAAAIPPLAPIDPARTIVYYHWGADQISNYPSPYDGCRFISDENGFRIERQEWV